MTKVKAKTSAAARSKPSAITVDAKTPAPLQLSPSIGIPFDKLVVSDTNVRTIKDGVTIEQLADDIAHRTLLQSLSVRHVLDAAGNVTAAYHVQAGGRRYRALALLVKSKRLAKDAIVPCILRTDGLAEEDSLAENTHREALHPLDQFRAFKALVEKGVTDVEIAARFFTTAAVVKQRLALANVSPKLHKFYASAEITLDQLMAFTVTTDHARQESVWATLSPHANHAQHIRRKLTETSVSADDRRVRYVGIAAYETAGGAVSRDLFQQDNGGWLTNPEIIDRLVLEKLTADAKKIEAEGWKWVAADVELAYGHDRRFRRIRTTEVPLSKKDEAARTKLQSQVDELERDDVYNSMTDDQQDAANERLDALQAAIAVYDAKETAYDPAEIAIAGAFVTFDDRGALSVKRGYVRPEDEPKDALADANVAHTPSRETTEPARAIIPTRGADGRVIYTTVGDTPAARTLEGDDVDTSTNLSFRLLMELSAHRTLAIRNAMADSFDVAMTALLHALCLKTIYHRGGTCLDIDAREPEFSIQGPDLWISASATSIEDRTKHWKAQLPADAGHLWSALDSMNDHDRRALFATCVSLTVDATHEQMMRNKDKRANAEAMASRLAIDMASEWSPTAANYFSRVPKPLILAAVREAKGDKHAALIEHLKKADMAAEAERMLKDTGWLPDVLKTIPTEIPGALPPEPADAADNDGQMPEFLQGMNGEHAIEPLH